MEIIGTAAPSSGPVPLFGETGAPTRVYGPTIAPSAATDGKSSKRAESIVVVGGDDDGETSAADSDLACQYPPCTGSGPPLVRT